ncbi:MAG: hypothetical protein ABIH23_24430 [bacterium]
MPGREDSTLFCRKFLVSISGAILLTLCCLSASAVSLQVAESRSVFDGEGPHTGQLYGSISGLPVVWTGTGFGLVYYEYDPNWRTHNYFLLLLDEDAQPVRPPIHLNQPYGKDAKLLWDGTAYICLISSADGLNMKRFLPSGEMESETTSPLSEKDGPYFYAFLHGDRIRIVLRVQPDSVEWFDISTGGVQLSDPIRKQLPGDLERATISENTLTILSHGEESLPSPWLIPLYVNFFDEAGYSVGDPMTIERVLSTPYRALHWNGSHHLCIAGRQEANEVTSILAFKFNQTGESLEEPTTAGEIPPEGRLGKVNFECNLIWTGSQYLLVWDQGASPDEEDIYARLLDTNGYPLSDPLKINSEPLLQANHGGVWTGDGFAIFGVEAKNGSPSVLYTRAVIDTSPRTPTPTPTVTPTPLPLPPHDFVIHFRGRSYAQTEHVFEIKGGEVWRLGDTRRGNDWTVTGEFPVPLPSYSVDLTGEIVSGPGQTKEIRQPRPENDFTARVTVERYSATQEEVTDIAFVWEEAPLPTATPTPVGRWGSMTFAGYIDGTDYLHVQGDRVWYEHEFGLVPGLDDDLTYINDEPWEPAWEDPTSYQQQMSDSYTSVNPPLPQEEGYFFRLDRTATRGWCILAQTPNAANNYEAIVLLDDIYNADAEWYEFSLVWSDTPPPTPMPPANGDYLIWRGSLATWHEVLMEIQGDSVTLQSSRSHRGATYSLYWSMPLPDYPVNVSAQVTQSDVAVTLIEQPRGWNGYTLRVVLEAAGLFSSYVCDPEILFTWGEQIEPEATPTPWPTWNSNAPTPTPIPGPPKVLWVAKPGALTGFLSPFEDISEFAQVFVDMGAENEIVIAGLQPITDELLNGHAAAIFDDSDDVEPLSDSEIESIVRFVRSGGSILVFNVCHGEYIPDESTLYLSSITKPFGISFFPAASSSDAVFRLHPLTNGVKRLLIREHSTLSVEPPAEAIGRLSTGEIILAVADDGYGRVVAFGEREIFLTSGSGVGESDAGRRFKRNLAAWLLHLEDSEIPPLPTPTPTYRPPEPGQDVQALIDKVLAVNKPWLDPKRIEATYGFYRESAESEGYILRYTSVNEGGPTAPRMGSVVYTALHAMTHDSISYTAQIVGRTELNGVPVVAIDVTFDPPAQEKIGLVCQGGHYYSSGGTESKVCRLLIDAERGVPLLIASSGVPIQDVNDVSATWLFDPDFYSVDGGFAPRMLEWDAPSSFRERQEFQVVEGVWIFETGTSWFGEASQFGGRSDEVIQTISLVDLIITDSGETAVEDWALY